MSHKQEIYTQDIQAALDSLYIDEGIEYEVDTKVKEGKFWKITVRPKVSGLITNNEMSST